jgi:hypothetical protein
MGKANERRETKKQIISATTTNKLNDIIICVFEVCNNSYVDKIQ